MTPIHMISNELVAAALFDRTLLRCDCPPPPLTLFASSSRPQPRVASIASARSCDLLILREIRLANVVDFRGRTPLHWMAIRGSLSAAKALLQSGSDWTLKDNVRSVPADSLRATPRPRLPSARACAHSRLCRTRTLPEIWECALARTRSWP